METEILMKGVLKDRCQYETIGNSTRFRVLDMSEEGKYMKKICIVTTLWSSINNWIKPFLNEYDKRGISVAIVCNMDSAYEESLKQEFPFIHTYSIGFPRGISIKGSIDSILKLYRYLKKEKFDMIQYSTPNASMYASIAAWWAKIPIRLYCQWGMVYVTMHGVKRFIFKNIERLVCKLSTEVQPDSIGNLEFCRKEGFYNEKKSCVIWNGSAKGLDLTAFDVTKKDEYKKEVFEKYGIESGTPIIGFVGRLGKEKGCNELFKAFRKIHQKMPKAKLLFVGPIEKEETIEPELLKYFWKCDDIIKTDRVSNVEKYISAMDIFVLPSYREGFGMSVVEASAMEVPVVVTKYPGPSSAMKEGVSGYSVPVQDSEALYASIMQLLLDHKQAEKLGKQGRNYVETHFEQKQFTQYYMENRIKLLQ